MNKTRIPKTTAGYEVDIGTEYFDEDEEDQITALVVPKSALKENGENMAFTCIVTLPGTDATIQATTELRFYRECCLRHPKI